MKKLALIALPLSFALMACEQTTEETTVEPMATETAMVEPMATDTMAPMDPMATDTTAADPMATGTATPMATETPM